MNGDAPVVLGHRGAPRECVENTLTSLHRALERGAAGIECDLRLTRDGEVVVFHDDDLERLAGRPDRVDALDWSDLSTVVIGRDERIPRLADLLATWPRDAWLDLELKSGGEALARSVVAVVGARPRGFISSFDHALLQAVESTGWNGERWLLVEPPGDPKVHVEAAKDLSVRGVIFPAAAWSRPVVEHYVKQGLRVGAWGGVDAAHEQQLAAWGLDYVITDEPRARL